MPSGAVSRREVTLKTNTNSFSLDSERTGARNLARSRSKVLRSYIKKDGIKRGDMSSDSRYVPFEPSVDEKPKSPADINALRNSGGLDQRHRQL
jgi:hypothetical protein